MVVLSSTALLPIYVIGKLHWPKFGEMLLVHATMSFCFECLAQCFSTQRDVIIGMLNFIGIWFAFYLFCGTVVSMDDVLMPLRLYFFVSPLRYALRSLLFTEFIDTVFTGAVKCVAPALRPLCAITSICPMYCIRGVFTCPGDPYGIKCFGRDGAEILTTLSVWWYPGFISPISSTVADIRILLSMAFALKLAYATRLWSRCNL